jgi:hypothetical protein
MSVAKSRELTVIFDFKRWQDAKQWSYISGFALISKISERENVVLEEIVLPFGTDPDLVENYLISRITFPYSRIYVWWPHTDLSEVSLKHLRLKSSQLFIIITESLVYSDDEISQRPHFASRISEFVNIASKSDSIISLCPATTDVLTKQGFNTQYWSGLIDINFLPSKDLEREGYLSDGTLYSSVRQELERHLRENFGFELNNQKFSDSKARLLFHEILMLIFSFVIRVKLPLDSMSAISRILRSNRKFLSNEYLNFLSSHRLVLALPSWFKGLTGKMIECAVTETPLLVISSDLHPVTMEKLNGLGIKVLAEDKFFSVGDFHEESIFYLPNRLVEEIDLNTVFESFIHREGQ